MELEKIIDVWRTMALIETVQRAQEGADCVHRSIASICASHFQKLSVDQTPRCAKLLESLATHAESQPTSFLYANLSKASNGSLTMSAASFNCLPTEIKAEIVHHVTSGDPSIVDTVGSKRNRNATGLLSLALVDKAMNAIITPLLWRKLVLRGVSHTNLANVSKSMIQKGQHVKELEIDFPSLCERLSNGETYESPNAWKARVIYFLQSKVSSPSHIVCCV